MNQMTKQESLTFRASLKVSRFLNPALHDTLVSLPQRHRSDFVLQVLKDWSRGLLTETPSMPGNPAIDGDAGTAGPSTASEQVAVASPPARPQSRPALPDAGTKLATQQSNAAPGQREPASDGTSNASNDDRPTRTLADLGIKSETDWNDAFDYGTPPA